jgi:hypothetical protein
MCPNSILNVPLNVLLLWSLARMHHPHIHTSKAAAWYFWRNTATTNWPDEVQRYLFAEGSWPFPRWGELGARV